MTNYRAQLYEYLQNRMTAIAPNVTVLVGELVGARLISHAGMGEERLWRESKCTESLLLLTVYNCRFAVKFGKASRIHRSDFRCGKSSIPSSQSASRYTKIWPHLSRATYWAEQRQIEGQGEWIREKLVSEIGRAR